MSVIMDVNLTEYPKLQNYKKIIIVNDPGSSTDEVDLRFLSSQSRKAPRSSAT